MVNCSILGSIHHSVDIINQLGAVGVEGDVCGGYRIGGSDRQGGVRIVDRHSRAGIAELGAVIKPFVHRGGGVLGRQGAVVLHVLRNLKNKQTLKAVLIF